MTPFTLEGLRELLTLGGPRVFWRHDVDCDLDAAVTVAEVEADAGVRATFFLWLRSPFYNLCGPEGDIAIHRLRELGHRVGLHVDLGVERDACVTADEILDALEVDYAIAFEAHGDVFDGGVSLHKPPASALWVSIEGVEYAYDSIWNGFYRSDSRRELPDDLEQVLADHGMPLQVNLHPENWVYPDGDWMAAREARHRRAVDELNDRVPSPPSDTSAREAALDSVAASDSWWPYDARSRAERQTA